MSTQQRSFRRWYFMERGIDVFLNLIDTYDKALVAYIELGARI